MAYASWVNPNKVSGNGNDTVSWTGSEHTGRSPRTTQATFSAANVEDKILTIIQAAKPEFVSFNDSTAAVLKAGGTLTLTGKSNSSKLTFSLGSNAIGLVLPSTYTANGLTVNNGAAITGDPGANAEYTFSIVFNNIPENTTIDALVSQLIVEDDGGDTSTCAITQAAGDPYLTISPTTINLTAAGTPAQSVSVSSNTNWSIS